MAAGFLWEIVNKERVLIGLMGNSISTVDGTYSEIRKILEQARKSVKRVIYYC